MYGNHFSSVLVIGNHMTKNLLLALLPALATSAFATDVLRVTAPSGTTVNYTLVMAATLKASQVEVKPAPGVKMTPAELRDVRNEYQRFLNEQLARDINLDKLPSLSFKGTVHVQSSDADSASLRINFTIPDEPPVSFVQRLSSERTLSLSGLPNSKEQLSTITRFPFFEAFTDLPGLYYQQFEAGMTYIIPNEWTGAELAAKSPFGITGIDLTAKLNAPVTLTYQGKDTLDRSTFNFSQSGDTSKLLKSVQPFSPLNFDYQATFIYGYDGLLSNYQSTKSFSAKLTFKSEEELGGRPVQIFFSALVDVQIRSTITRDGGTP
jgi:hypothetical protein